MARKQKRHTGQVSVNYNRGWLRLRFPQKFKNFLASQGEECPTYLSLYLKEVDPDTKINNWPRAEAIAAAINADWLSDSPEKYLDITLKRYLGDLYRDKTTAPAAKYPFPVGREFRAEIYEGKKVLLKDIWQPYLDHHLVGKKISTHRAYEQYDKKLSPWLEMPVGKEVAKLIRKDFIEANNYLVKNAIAALTSALNWAITEEIYVGVNPFLGISQEIFPASRVDKITGLPFHFVAFTPDEVNLILDGFLNEALTYYAFFKFKFLTGCRTGEAIALTWQDIKFSHKVISFNKTYLSNNNTVSPGTKGRRKAFQQRQFPLNDNLFSWLENLKPTFVKETDLVFQNRDGGFLNTASLSFVWGNKNPEKKIGVVSGLAMEGRLNYLPPYNTRHTFVSFCLENGLDATTIADWCGNSDRVIQEVYRSRSRDVDLTKMPQW